MLLGDGNYKFSCMVSKGTVRSIRYCQARQVHQTIPPSLHPHQRAVLPRFANWCWEALTPHKLPNLGLDSAAQDASPMLNINTSLESNPSTPRCSSWDYEMKNATRKLWSAVAAGCPSTQFLSKSEQHLHKITRNFIPPTNFRVFLLCIWIWIKPLIRGIELV